MFVRIVKTEEQEEINNGEGKQKVSKILFETTGVINFTEKIIFVHMLSPSILLVIDIN